MLAIIMLWLHVLKVYSFVIAFNARVPLGDTINVESGVPLIFTEEIFDIGGDHDDGIFTAPCSGIYDFTWTIFPKFESGFVVVSFDLIVNNADQVYSSIFFNDVNLSVQTKIELNENDQVYLVVNENVGFAVSISSFPDAYSMFAGSRIL